MTTILCIIDGLGICDEPQLSIPFIDKHLSRAVLLEASGQAVGLVEGQMGSSEVGHMTIGAGRIIKQNLTRINDAIENNCFPDITGKTFHIVGLLSDGGVHSHIDHIFYLIKHIGDKDIFLHIITDGRDTPPKSAERYIEQLESLLNDKCKIATISGRYYAMDRDNRYERTEAAFQAIALGKSEYKYSKNFIEEQYSQGITDEFFLPAVSPHYNGILPNDTIIFANFRSDRMVQIVKKIHSEVKVKESLSMVDYFNDKMHSIKNLFSKEEITDTLGEVMYKMGKRQLRIAETEKYAHVTFFFNCGREDPFPGEERIVVSSPKVKTYDLKPAMSAYEITEKLIYAINSRQYAFICVNFANADMVGHTGNFSAAKEACDVINQCLESIYSCVTVNNDKLFITADHGNIEQMFDLHTNQPYTSHTLNKVPFISIGHPLEQIINYKHGLQDIAPTILKAMEIAIPSSITGKSLIKP